MKKKKPVKIKILAGHPDTGKLTLDLKGSTTGDYIVNAGDTVEWILKDDAPNVLFIWKIHEEEGNENIFIYEPQRKKRTNNFCTEVKPDAQGQYENYYIKWIDTTNVEHTYDPKLTVNP